MSVKASVSLSEQQDCFARALVADGKYASVSAVVQRGLELLRAEAEREEAELNALRAFFQARADGDFVPAEDGRRRTEEMLARKRLQHGL
ncbi:type II toxin-antitoxin system ParD family antitoxin [Palleronia caenipelagi]|uniref:Type II toxin-antitoxin system ParD family antitoxin n=1 Tax=Palleronia caenipelagi TaxID=2489174 RepID=A0A547PUD0_9RHOB|nr:type II toxin-antitoxin system ParD family antitoxin [Palleronia caenipelagi]TRD17738.1 type II toxin-antitoxin system ParD family antitoxin [Palleronia caenipelagi]